ncbi:MAG TPA: PDZ domain-containing protein [Bryobacteraceae bacterium]|jgi:serine protease Do|nr:PDZ domain-containing protein [Bryobacteraceae bacterium]
MIALLLTTLILNANALPAQPVTEPDCEVVYWRSQPVLQPQVVDGDTGYLGVSLLDLDAEHVRTLKLTGDRGVEIRAVMEGGPADKAGIQPGDVVLTYNGESIMGAQQLSRLVQETPPGRRVKVQYWRDGKVEATLVSVGTISMGPSRFQTPQPSDLQFPDVDFPFPMLLWHNPVVGIDYERVDSQLAAYFGVKSGVLVRAVQPGSAADKAGLRAGDVIFSVAQQTSFTDHEISSLFRRHSSVSVSVMRDHKRIGLMLNVP